MQSADFQTTESTTVLKTNWFEPELGRFLVSFDVDVRPSGLSYRPMSG